jgi:hypothetical protein
MSFDGIGVAGHAYFRSFRRMRMSVCFHPENRHRRDVNEHRNLENEEEGHQQRRHH